MTNPFESVAQAQDVGTLWFGLIILAAFLVYLAPTLKRGIEQWFVSRTEASNRYAIVLENTQAAIGNSTAALANNTAALENNTAAMRDFKQNEEECKTLIVEHDKKSEIRLGYQVKQLDRIESKIDERK